MAKKNYDQPNGLAMLKQHLKAKDPQRLYIFHGEDVFLLKHYLGQLKKLLVDELTEQAIKALDGMKNTEFHVWLAKLMAGREY